jgi:hypothetical protein
MFTPEPVESLSTGQVHEMWSAVQGHRWGTTTVSSLQRAEALPRVPLDW